jgi:hypothetical protein
MSPPHMQETWKNMPSLILPSLPRSSVTLSTRRLVLKYERFLNSINHRTTHPTKYGTKNLPTLPCYHSLLFLSLSLSLFLHLQSAIERNPKYKNGLFQRHTKNGECYTLGQRIRYKCAHFGLSGQGEARRLKTLVAIAV